MDGVLVCDKPAQMTSHDVVARVRRLAGQRRVGHGGTLDPPATGVLVLALGRATRLLPFLPTEPKRYLARIAFGAETDTLDAAGEVTATADAGMVDQAGLRAALAGFLGPQEQVPPMVSAIKMGGERLYAKARRGEEVERAARPIVIHDLELLGLAPGERPLATISVVCSGGTYVRSLAADLGQVALGLGGQERQQPGGPAKGQDQHPGGRRVEGAAVPDPALPGQAAYPRDHVVGGQPRRLVADEHPVHRGASPYPTGALAGAVASSATRAATAASASRSVV